MVGEEEEMNPWIIIVECVVFLALFCANVFRIMNKDPLSAVSDYPPEIQEAYYQSQGKAPERKKLSAKSLAIKVVSMLVYMAILTGMAFLAGARTFWDGFWAIVIYGLAWFAFDTFFIDWYCLPRNRQWWLPGTEHMEREYRQKWFHVKACFPMVPVFVAVAVLVGLIVMWTH